MLQKSSLGALGGQGRCKVEQILNSDEKAISTAPPPGILWEPFRYLLLSGTPLGLKNGCLGKDPFYHRF